MNKHYNVNKLCTKNIPVLLLSTLHHYPQLNVNIFYNTTREGEKELIFEINLFVKIKNFLV